MRMSRSAAAVSSELLFPASRLEELTLVSDAGMIVSTEQ